MSTATGVNPRILGALSGAILMALPIVASAASLAIESLIPSASISPGQRITFYAVPSGFTNPAFSISDSFAGSSISSTTISASGGFWWIPSAKDNGIHTVTVSANDNSGNSAMAVQTITVGSGTAVIQSIIPGSSLPVGNTMTFNVVVTGFSNPVFSVKDSASGSSITDANISQAGSFSWTPKDTDGGIHKITVSVSDVYGDFASAETTVEVTGGITPAAAAAAAAAASTASTTASLLDSLMAKVSELNGKITTLKSEVPAEPAFVFSMDLRRGNANGDVKQLQDVLAKQGFFSAAPNGNFGPATEAAVKQFQKAMGIAALGVVGPATRSALNQLAGAASAVSAKTTAASGAASAYVFSEFLGVGSQGEGVTALQNKLTALGFYSGPVNGRFGPATEAAVKKFQKANGLPQFGYVGPGTRSALNSK